MNDYRGLLTIDFRRSLVACTIDRAHSAPPQRRHPWTQTRNQSKSLVDYEAFRTAWTEALRASRLPLIGIHANETLDTRRLDRSYVIFVEPFGGQDAPP